MRTIFSIPAPSASSTTSWIVGTSTIGSISFGIALVAGRNRVPRPAAGMTAALTRFAMRRTVSLRGCADGGDFGDFGDCVVQRLGNLVARRDRDERARGRIVERGRD